MTALQQLIPLALVVTLLFQKIDYSIAQQGGDGDTPSSPSFSCEVCGCDACTPGLFPMLNPAGAVAVTPELWDKLDNEVVPGTNETVAGYLKLYGFAEQVPCQILDALHTWENAAIFSGLCTDSLRLLPEFRIGCGCPSIPEEGFNSSLLPEDGSHSVHPAAAAAAAPSEDTTTPFPTPPTLATPSVLPMESTDDPLFSRLQRRWIILSAVVVLGLSVHLCVRANVVEARPPAEDDIGEATTVEVQESYLTSIEVENLEKALADSLRGWRNGGEEVLPALDVFHRCDRSQTASSSP